jgi:hypothetical protein
VVSQLSVPVLEHAVQSLDLVGGHCDFGLIFLVFISKSGVLLHLLGELSDVESQLFNFSVFGFIAFTDSPELYLKLAALAFVPQLEFLHFPFCLNFSASLQVAPDLFNLLVL